MRWWTFAILAIVTLLIQSTLAPMLSIRGSWPDLLFILAIHYALWGPWPDVGLAGWLLGLLMDLQSHGRVGLHAFAFGGVAWAIYYVRRVLFRDHWLTQMLITFVFAGLVRLGVQMYDSIRSGAGPEFSANVAPALGVALYTALLAPYIHWPLIRMHRWTGLKPTQRTALGTS